jgi:hypothetical protein
MPKGIQAERSILQARCLLLFLALYRVGMGRLCYSSPLLSRRLECVLRACCASGDRYLLKLFRDFVLHQVRDDGTPMLDWGHVVECLNKLDAGAPEKVFPNLFISCSSVAHTYLCC